MDQIKNKAVITIILIASSCRILEAIRDTSPTYKTEHSHSPSQEEILNFCVNTSKNKITDNSIMPSTPPNRDLLLQMNASLVNLQKSLDAIKIELLTSKADLKEIKQIIKNRSKPPEEPISRGWIW